MRQMQVSRVVRFVSLSAAFLLPGAIAAADDEALPPVTAFIDSEPVPPSIRGSGVDAGQPSITPFIDSAPIASDPAMRSRRWYGGEIIAADLGTFACVALTQHELCLFPYLFAGAVIHAVHRQSGAVGRSFALRLLAPSIGGAMGGLIGGCPFSQQPTDSPDFPPCLGEMVVGMLVGLAGGLVLDAALAFTPPAAPVADRPARTAVQLAPRLSFGQAHLTLGLSATF